MNRQSPLERPLEAKVPITRELRFIAEQTGEDELSLLSRALHLGLHFLYHQAVEQAYIDGNLARPDAVETLGAERVDEIDYAKKALAQDIARGLSL
ncbi:MAG: hypothetical protein U1F76_13075 [Candidatus Competibacteraceae bacterium]